MCIGIDNDGAASFFSRTDGECSAPQEPLPWARGEANGDRRALVRLDDVWSCGTEVRREGAMLQPVWPVRSRGALVAHVWLFSLDLKRFGELSTLAPNAIRKRWTAWFNKSYIVAERVSAATQFSTWQSKACVSYMFIA
jgi:hypothetical protein